MKLEEFGGLLSNAYKNGYVSNAAVEGINKICSDYDISKTFAPTDFNTADKKYCLFDGPGKEGYDRLEKLNPKITVIIPTYNRADFLTRCVDSILEQTYENFEIIIIDDCSTDNTSEIVKKRYGADFRIKYVLNETNLGPGGNRQKAYLMMSGEYVIFADDDDYYFEPEFFKKALAVFMERENLSMVCANSIFFDDVNKSFAFYALSFCGEMDREKFFFGFNTKYRKPNSTFPSVFKKSVLDRADFANMKMMNDASIYMRAACFGNVCMLRDWVGVYWQHGTNISKKLPFDFIMENLDEKNNIYALAKAQFAVNNPEWLLAQQMYTLNYFYKSKKLSFFKYRKLKKWIKANGGEIKEKLMKSVEKLHKES